ncbi:MAG: rhodanese-like domain-containing protein [Gammaproteobacteria bacterium]|nr:rhodanese-like domain-containing protein [Gammaproteobacteria bacterium]
MKTFVQLVAECQQRVKELYPWDLSERLRNMPLLIVDVREPAEFQALHIQGSINIPRGILETACEYDFDETVPQLVQARDKPVVVVCRSGNRSIFAADVMQQLGYQQVWSLKTGLRGWNDNESPLVDTNNRVIDADFAEEFLATKVRAAQRKPR